MRRAITEEEATAIVGAVKAGEKVSAVAKRFRRGYDVVYDLVHRPHRKGPPRRAKADRRKLIARAGSDWTTAMHGGGDATERAAVAWLRRVDAYLAAVADARANGVVTSPEVLAALEKAR